MHIVLSSAGDGVLARDLDDDESVTASETLTRTDLPAWVAARERQTPRWVWDETALWYPPLLAADVRVERSVDLRLCHAILRSAAWVADSELATAEPDPFEAPRMEAPTPNLEARVSSASTALFDLGEVVEQAPPRVEPDPLDELRRQRAAVRDSEQRRKLTLLLAAESVGALVAAEMSFVGLPWSATRHDEILTEMLGPRPVVGRPAKLEQKLEEFRAALDDPTVDPDSPVQLLRSLQNAGIRAESTRSWELKELKHPAIAPLLEYKKLARLLSANGWHWLDEWIHDGRFRPVYVPGGVVTGRWASDGGGALQLPKQVRGAVVADPGWTFVVADASQLEPRVLAAMSQDGAMALAGQEQDMYEGIVRTGAVADRNEAKYGMLGAIYGGTSGVSGRVLPRITRAFPKAMGMVENAARAGEKGESVHTWLGRTSPPGRAAEFDETASAAERRNDQSRRKAWGRFTRNFIVQGTAAEWALCWMGSLRRRLWELGEPSTDDSRAQDAPLTARPHLAFFLHDELVVHTPLELADQVADALTESAAEAGRLLFGSAPVQFALTVAVVDTYDKAK